MKIKNDIKWSEKGGSITYLVIVLGFYIANWGM